MTIVVLSVAGYVGLTVVDWRRTRPAPIPPAPRLPGWTIAAARAQGPAPRRSARPLPPPRRIADIADPRERHAAAWDHARRRTFVRNPFEIGTT